MSNNGKLYLAGFVHLVKQIPLKIFNFSPLKGIPSRCLGLIPGSVLRKPYRMAEIEHRSAVYKLNIYITDGEMWCIESLLILEFCSTVTATDLSIGTVDSHSKVSHHSNTVWSHYLWLYQLNNHLIKYLSDYFLKNIYWNYCELQSPS